MDKRALLAIVLSVAVLVAWQVLFAPAPPPSQAPPSSPPGAPTPESTAPGAPSPTASAPGPGSTGGPGIPPTPIRPRPTHPGPRSEVRTPLYHVVFDADGSVRSWVLQYRGTKELLLDDQVGALAVTLIRAGGLAEPVPLAPGVPSLDLGPAVPAGALTFTGRTPDGLRVGRTLRFSADSFQIEVELRVEGARPGEPVTAALSWSSPLVLLGAAGAVERAEGNALVVVMGEGRDRRAWTFVLTPGTRMVREGKAISAREVGPEDGATVTYRESGGQLVAKSVEVKRGKKPPRDATPWTFGEGPDHLQLLGRILVARNGRPDSLDAPPAALKEGKESPAGPELKDPHPVPTSVLAPGPRWIAVENDYFIAALIPSGDSRVLRGRTKDWTEVGIIFPEARQEAGRPWEASASLYVGPKEWSRLSALGVGLEQAQARNYGDFLYIPWLPMEWFCVPLLWLMNFLATRLPGQNYGVAIILLTVLVKIAFYPLTHKSMTSMKEMQALQPQLNALRAKYKSDSQRFQREQMELFRKHKVNPMGGCLPMVVQIPIFYALYVTLQFSVELQGASFVLWITDLSKKDPYYVLPILMGVSMLVQQKMTPTVGDPRQAKVMLIMPVIFTFMFLEFPTGLVLYWLVNNVLSIAQQYVIDRTILRKKASAVAEKASREPRKA